MNLLKDFFNTTEPARLIQSFPTVDKRDWAVFTLINPRQYSAVVAGGAALTWYQGQAVGTKDIDVWFRKDRDRVRMIRDLKTRGFRQRFDTENAITFAIEIDSVEFMVQLIKNPEFNNVHELISRFDVTVSQIATDGFTWWFGPQFLEDFKNRRLRLTKTHPGIMKRVIKYWCYGFTPQDQDLQQILEDDSVNWDYSKISFTNDYDNAF